MTFSLHPQLQKDCIDLGKLDLCQVLLMNDSRFPWLILVPQRNNISEIYQLSTDEQHQLINESSHIATQLKIRLQADKINIAALGNQVAQLHIHHVVRYQTDVAWPAPIWGKFDTLAYTEKELHGIQNKLHNLLQR